MSDPLRVLLLDVNAGFLNPTRTLLPACLKRAFSLECFGPVTLAAAGRFHGTRWHAARFEQIGSGAATA